MPNRCVVGGWLRLDSSNPFDTPLINPAFLDTEFDVFAMRSAVKLAKRILASPAWAGWIIGPAGALANANTDEELDEYAKNNTETTCHAVGTAAMSAVDAPFGVVNSDLRVKGVQGLRIVDASIFVSLFHYISVSSSSPIQMVRWMSSHLSLEHIPKSLHI